MELLLKQYDYVKRTREMLFSYCEKMTDAAYITEVEHFGPGSICGTHFHVAECYAFWLGEFALERTFNWRVETVVDVAAMRSYLWKLINWFLNFWNAMQGRWRRESKGSLLDKSLQLHPFGSTHIL